MTQPSEFAGRWVSPQREPQRTPDGGTIYLVRDFDLTGSTWKLALSGYGDPQSEQSKLFTVVIDGHMSVGQPSPAAAGAFETDFAFEHITVTPFVDGFVQMLNGQRAGNGQWRVGEGQDISQTGGLFFRPVSQYPMEYDLLKREGDALYLGQRPADNNMGSPERRPRAVRPEPVVRRS